MCQHIILTFFYRKESVKKSEKKSTAKPVVNEAELKKKKLSSYGRKKKTKVVKKDSKKQEIHSTHDLFPELGKENVERAVKELCLANPKWSKVVLPGLQMMYFDTPTCPEQILDSEGKDWYKTFPL